MKKQYKIIGISLIIIIVIGSLVSFTSITKSSSEETDLNESKVSLLASMEAVKQLEINQEVVLKKVAGKQWIVEDLEQEADAEKINQAIELIATLQGTETDKESKEAGLTAPQVELNLIGEEAKQTVSIGAKAEDGLTYFVSVSDDDAVYQVDTADIEAIPLTKHALTNNRFLSVTPETVNKITINNGIQTIELKPESDYAKEEVRTNLSGWYMHQPYHGVYSVEYNHMTNMIYGLDQLEVEEIVEKKADKWKKYGLDHADFTITLQSKDKHETILIGDPAEEQTYYAMLKGEDKVFTICKEALNPYSYQALDMVDRFVKILAVDIVKQIKLEGKGKAFVIDITHKEMDQDEREGVTASSFQIDGKTIEDGAFRDLYKKIAGLRVDKEVEDATYKESEASIAYTILTGENKEKEILVELVPYDKEHFAIYINEIADFLVEKESFYQLLDEVTKTKETS